MDLLVRQTQDTVRLGRANRCRLYLQAPRVSDIVSCCGQYLRASVMQHQAEPRKGPVKLGWPRQGNPSEADWATWENLLRDALGINNAFHKLATRLGRWTMDWQDWEWYVSNDHQILVQMEHSSGTAHLRYRISDSRQVRYAPIPQRSIHYGQLRKLFPLVQVDIGRLESNNFYIERQAPLNMQWESDGPWKLPACPLLNQQFIDFTNQTAWAFQFNFGQQSIDGLMQLAASLSQGTVDACSDGSAKDGEGSTSWIMMYNGTAMSAGFKVPGAADTQDSYRNELAGLYAVVYVTRRVISLFHLQRARIEVACDRDSALDRVFGNPKPTSMTDNHWDMVELIKDELTLCPQLALEWRHVYGHQDEKNHRNKKGSPTESFRRQPLDKWARMNIQVDMQATFCRETPGSPVVLPGYDRLWRPTINQATIVQKVVQQVRRHCHSPQAKAYWTDKGRIGSSTPDDIDWHATGQAMLATSVNRTRFVIKAATGWCAVNRNMVRWKFDVVARCPRCNAPSETAIHLWRCQATSARSIWTDKLQSLEKWLRARQTCPQITMVILSRIRSWKANNRKAPFPQLRFRGLRIALLKQDRIGWDAAFEGRWSSDWAHVQQAYLTFIGSKKTGRRWLTMVIQKMWDIAWDLWEDRNGVNADKQAARQLLALQTRVTAEFQCGYRLLHFRSQALFTRCTLTQRLTHSEPTLRSWLLRVEQARRRCLLDPMSVNRDPIAQARRVERERLLTETAVTQTRMRTLLATWLAGR